ncbi:hypothetical protein [Bradyrhizobium sp. RDI18]|uniref:hypothetical protein n=1 Tax=Bradyrhizobium sp. RDI18 TaxID=3367400 RepID=UPI00371244EF
MTEADFNKLWNLVPVGEANAARASTIWKRLDMYARSTVQHQLSWMADAGHICRLSRCMPMGGDVRLYYRMQTNDAAYQCLSLKPLQAPPAHIDAPAASSPIGQHTLTTAPSAPKNGHRRQRM